MARKPSKSGLISVMMPAYNAGQYIGQAIESVLGQTYPDWELIIVNDGSTDDTPDKIVQYEDARIKVIQQNNSGEAAARNTALNYITGDFIAFLDADDLFLPAHLEEAASYLWSHPGYDAVYTDGCYIDQDGKILQALSSQRRGPFEGRLFEHLVRASDVFGPPICVVIRSELVFEHNLKFDPEIVIGPDWDFFTHYADLAQFGYLDRKSCLYRVHQTNITVRVQKNKRAMYLARCREKAIRMKSFASCSLETRTAVFYDLLVSLLTGYPDRQEMVTGWAEFNDLPLEQRGRLYRLMASQAILKGVKHRCVGEWLERARQTNPADRRTAGLFRLYRLSPWIAGITLRVRHRLQRKTSEETPFGTLGV